MSCCCSLKSKTVLTLSSQTSDSVAMTATNSLAFSSCASTQFDGGQSMDCCDQAFAYLRTAIGVVLCRIYWTSSHLHNFLSKNARGKREADCDWCVDICGSPHLAQLGEFLSKLTTYQCRILSWFCATDGRSWWRWWRWLWRTKGRRWLRGWVWSTASPTTASLALAAMPLALPTTTPLCSPLDGAPVNQKLKLK